LNGYVVDQHYVQFSVQMVQNHLHMYISLQHSSYLYSWTKQSCDNIFECSLALYSDVADHLLIM